MHAHWNRALLMKVNPGGAGAGELAEQRAESAWRMGEWASAADLAPAPDADAGPRFHVALCGCLKARRPASTGMAGRCVPKLWDRALVTLGLSAAWDVSMGA